MTLKEMFAKATGNGTYYVIPIVEDAEIIEKIADDFAIGFAYWCEWREDKAFKTYDELLEIYKKEKGL